MNRMLFVLLGFALSLTIACGKVGLPTAPSTLSSACDSDPQPDGRGGAVGRRQLFHRGHRPMCLDRRECRQLDFHYLRTGDGCRDCYVYGR